MDAPKINRHERRKLKASVRKLEKRLQRHPEIRDNLDQIMGGMLADGVARHIHKVLGS